MDDQKDKKSRLRHLRSFLIRRLTLTTGFIVFHWLIWRRGPYHGRSAVQRAVYFHDRGWFIGVSLAEYLLAEHVRYQQWKRALLEDLHFARTEAGVRQPSTRARADYGDDSLSGYGDEIYAKGGAELADQMRGAILPLLEGVLADCTGPVCEIGTGNGDVLAYLAQREPHREFVGIDFSVATAQRKWPLPNVRWIKGYAADELARCGAIETVFASGTFTLFTPAEMDEYERILARCGVTNLVLSEPHFHGYGAALFQSDQFSVHLEAGMWFHDYRRRLERAGYRCRRFEERPYRHPVSTRPSIVLTLLWAQRTSIAAALPVRG
jgi:hypothetical protein